MRRRTLLRGAAGAVLASFLVSPARAETATLTVDPIPEKVSGRVDVTGTASLGDGGGSVPQPDPLVADAGDSPLVEPGGAATLLGAGYGGTAPYSFAWTAEAGEVVGADAATAQLDTTGLDDGTYPVRLTITDAAGATATDTVLVVVDTPTTTTVVDETESDLSPGVFNVGAPGTYAYSFDVPRNAQSIEADLTYGLELNDFDIRVYDPNGTERTSSTQSIPNTEEHAAVPNPEPGTWSVVVEKYTTVPDSAHTVVRLRTVDDPRPAVTSGGPYRFALGAPQSVSATVVGGVAPVAVGWDTDGDGVLDVSGASASLDLPAGRHLVTVKATDAAGHERRETTSVLVADPERLSAETTAFTVLGVADSGINPYHIEYSAETYPDPDVLALTRNFTRHPSEYIPGFPADAKAIPVTLGQGYFPPQDAPLWKGDHSFIELQKMYWIPGTKIVGAWDANDIKPVNAAGDAQPILDDDGHGTGATSVSTGNRYGYCPTCLLVFVEGLDETVIATFPFVDVSSNSFGTVGGVPLDLTFELLGTDPAGATRAAAERGQLTFFAAGNGIGNAYDVPQVTYGGAGAGPDWNIAVGALRRDNERAIVGDGITVHLSSWGDGNLPSACRTGTHGQCAFGGTSAATPYTAGVAGTVLAEVRRAIGDGQPGQRPGQVVAEGVPVGNGALADGRLTRSELREALLKTAFPLNQENEPSPYPYPLTAPYHETTNVLFEGYGAATPESGQRAVDVLLGRAPMPDRSFEDGFFDLDRAVRDSLWGGYDRDGDGSTDSHASGTPLTQADVATPAGVVRALASPSLAQAAGDNAMQYFLHRRVAAEPGSTTTCGEDVNEKYMDTADTPDDLEDCFESRVTTVVAGFRPIGIWPSTTVSDAPLPAGSTVTVDLYVAQENPTVVQPTGVLMAGQREIGEGTGSFTPVLGSGAAEGCEAMGDLCWSRTTFSFDTTRPAFTGEHLTFQVALAGSRAFAFGYEGAHASSISITPAALPPSGLEFGVTVDDVSAEVAGGTAAFPDDVPGRRRVEVSVDDPTFASPIEATLDGTSWSAPLGSVADGEHTLYARAAIDRTVSDVAGRTFTVAPDAVVQWQVVPRKGTLDPNGWQDAAGVAQWSYSFDTATYGKGWFLVVTRLVQGGEEVARHVARTRFG